MVGNSGLTAPERAKYSELARSGQASVVCSTSVGGIGIDLQKLICLLVTEPSADLRDVEQLWGRTGRKDGSCGSVLITGTRGYRDWVRDFARQAQQISSSVLPPGQTKRYDRVKLDGNDKPKRRSSRHSDVTGQQRLF